MSKITDLQKKLTTKIVSCPACHQKIRTPIRKGKTLEIKCQKCATNFQIHFQSPFGEVFKWEQNLNPVQNIGAMWNNFKLLPYRAKLAFIAQLFMMVVMGFMLISIFRSLLHLS